MSAAGSRVPRTVVVTGSAGSVGRRVCALLAMDSAITNVIGLDLEPQPSVGRLETHRVDLRRDDLLPSFRGADTVVHLASLFRPTTDGVDVGPVDMDAAARVLEAASDAEVSRLILLSSAMVYGAHPTNPVPILEDAELAPDPAFSFAVAKAEIELMAEKWRSEGTDRTLVVLRPTTALAEGDVSWVARSLRAAAVLDVGEGDPPVQFLHLDDLASAVVLAISAGLHGAYNVAPDGWVDGETCRELSGRVPRLRMPVWVAEEVGRFRWRHGLAPTPPGLTSYTQFPWVVANDRLRRAGWEPRHSNEEAYVEGTPAHPWASMNAKRRQQLALGAAGVASAAVGIGLAAGMRALRRRG